MDREVDFQADLWEGSSWAEAKRIRNDLGLGSGDDAVVAVAVSVAFEVMPTVVFLFLFPFLFLFLFFWSVFTLLDWRVLSASDCEALRFVFGWRWFLLFRSCVLKVVLKKL